MRYDIHDLVSWIGWEGIERGQELYSRGEVRVVSGGASRRDLLGVVTPAGAGPSFVSVRFAPARRRDGRPRLEMRCSCEARRPCEHVAGLLYAGMAEANARAQVPADEHEAHVQRDVERWLRQLEEPPSHPEPQGGPKKRLLYLLDRHPVHPALTVHPRVVYRRKDGRYGGSTNCGYTAKGPRPGYVGPEDHELIVLLLALRAKPRSKASFQRPLPIAPETSPQLLRTLIATDRCHWRDADGSRVREGEARAGTIEWVVHDDGTQSTRLCVEGLDEPVVLPVRPPWYLDTASGVAGPVALALEPQVARALLQAPALPALSVPRVREALSDAGAAEAQLPRSLEVERREVAPVPMLRLHTHRYLADNAWNTKVERELPLVGLRFDYDGHTVAPHDIPRALERVTDDRVESIARQLGAESEAIAWLEREGLRSLEEEEADALGLPDRGLSFLPDFAGDPGDFEARLIALTRELVPRLRESGWRVEIEPSWPYSFVEGEVRWVADVDESARDWFALGLGIEVGGEHFPLLPILLGLLRDRHFEEELRTAEPGASIGVRLADGRLLSLEATRLRAIVAVLTELLGGGEPLDEHGRLALDLAAAPRLDELQSALDDAPLGWSGGERIRALATKLRGFDGLTEVDPPAGLEGELRPYQRIGLNWLQFLREHGLGGVLADEMGLGKTVQVLAHLLVERAQGRADRPSLVVAPTSVLPNWRREAERFAPSLRTLVLHGPERKSRFDAIADHDLVLTTYPLLGRDREVLTAERYHTLVLDEAQFIKNARTKASRVAREIEARHRICLTGTPLENNLGELWALFHVLMPGLLGEARLFRKLFRTPIEKHDDGERREQLASRVRPFLLRRTKNEVAVELPPKTEMVRSIELGRAQRDLYESIRVTMDERVRKEVARRGLAQSTVVILDALLKLRQVCCDPRLVRSREARRVTESAKLDALMELLTPLLAEGQRILLFSQFTTMLGLIEERLEAKGLQWLKLTGRTRDRETPVRRFQDGEVPLFLISLKAGGTGLNLTAADTVIHYDPWWNPAVEDQATDRAHRIGQDQPVFVFRLIVDGSVEDGMLALQARKRALAEGLYGKRRGASDAPFSEAALAELFQPLEGVRSCISTSAQMLKSKT